MTEKTKYALAVAVLIVVGAIIYSARPAGNGAPSIQQKNASNARGAEKVKSNPSKVLQGRVVSVNVRKMEIAVQTSANNPQVKPADSGSISIKTVRIDSATKIEKIISQKNAKGIVEKQALIEVTIDDVQKGATVTVVYEKDTQDVLTDVKSIAFVVEANIDAYMTSAETKDL